MKGNKLFIYHGNVSGFGIAKSESGEKLDGEIPEYQVLTPDREDRTLVFWYDGEVRKVPKQKTIQIREKKFRTGLLNLADPPLGWD